LAKVKKKLTTAQKQAKAEYQKKYMWIFISGKQVRVKRPQLIDGIDIYHKMQTLSACTKMKCGNILSPMKIKSHKKLESKNNSGMLQATEFNASS
jgi:hypothetical protein